MDVEIDAIEIAKETGIIINSDVRARGRSRGQKNLGKTKMEDSDELDDMEKLILEREEKVMLEREQNPIDPQRLRRQVVE